MTTSPVITAATTIQHGPMVCWHRSLAAAEGHRAALVATREGVDVRELLTDIPADWVEAAKQAHLQLVADPKADMSRWATHQRRDVLGVRSGPLEPVNKEG